MARTTAEIDGDSSGLVGALDKGRAGMVKMEAEGKKLTDQLREVADEADKAAGALVQKIGGPTAIKAIGGVGVAMGVAKAGVEAFLGSAEALFRSFGEEGQKVWDETEKSLFAIKGAFAEAVLGGGSVEQMGARLKSIFDGVKTALDFALTPLKLLSQAFVDNSIGAQQAATATNLYNEAVANSAKTTANQITLVGELTQKYLALTNQTDALKLSEIGQSLARIRMQQAELWAAEKKNDEAAAQAEVAAQREKLAFESAREFAKPHKRVPIYPGASTFYDPRENETQREILQRLTDRALAEAREKYKDLSVETRLQLDQLKSLYDMFGALYAEVGKKVEEPPKGNLGLTAPVNEATDKLIDLDALIDRIQAKNEAFLKPFREAEERAGKAVGDWVASLFPREDLLTSWQELATGVKEVWGQVVDAVTRGEDDMKESAVKTADAHSALYDKYIAQNAKMVAVALEGGKSMSEIAQAAIGNIISALGDEAFSMASIEFFKGNFAGAAGLTAAGMAAYATASYLGSNAKKAGGSTKATTAPTAPTVTNNTAFNLQIDAAFADEESIARSFSKAQALARARHMTPYAMT